MELAPVPREPDEPFVPDLSEGAEAGLYLSLFELMNEGLIITSDETILEVNSAVCRLMERSYRDLAGQPLSTLFPSERAFLQARASLFIQGEMRGSLRVRLPRGRERDLAYVAAARIRPGVHAIILSPDPVTGLGDAPPPPADAVWPRLAAALDQPAMVIDAKDRIMAANAPARRRFAHIDDTLTGKSLKLFCQLSEPTRESGPITVMPSDGSPDLHGRLLPGPESGWRILLLSGATPVTPVDARSGRIFKHAPVPMLVVRASDRQILAANDAAANMLGHPRPNLLQHKLGTLGAPISDDRELSSGTWRWHGKTGTFDMETHAQPLDGNRFEWLLTLYAPMPVDGAGAADGLRYSPIVDTRSGKVISADVVFPGHEDPDDLIAHLTTACEQARKWAQHGISLNIPTTLEQLSAPSFAAALTSAAESATQSGAQLSIGLPEADITRLTEGQRAQISALQATGVTLGVREVGLQPLPMAQLMEFSVRTLTLAPALVHDCVSGPKANLACATLAIAGPLGLVIHAAGVANHAQAEALLKMGCHLIQGEHVGPTMTAEALTQRI